MQKDERDLLEVLKSELQFLEQGGYGRSPRTPWRPQYTFEDSFTCLNYDSKENPGPCSNCVLIQLVPTERRSEKIPCRHIPFNVTGETLDSLYRYSDQNEIEETVGSWLRTTIQGLEEERIAVQRNHNKQAAPRGGARRGTLCIRSSIRSVQTRRVPLPFIGPAAESSSDFDPIRFRQAGVIQPLIRQGESTT